MGLTRLKGPEKKITTRPCGHQGSLAALKKRDTATGGNSSTGAEISSTARV